MTLFNRNTECAKENTHFCSGEQTNRAEEASCCGEVVNGICCIKVLGSGCVSCHRLFENVKKAAEGTGIKIEYVTDLQKIMDYGAMSMPALVVNDKVVSVGRILKPSEIAEILGM